jgi:hypothetical protein
MAAALGVPTWFMCYGPDWHQHGRKDNPWYPSARPFTRRCGDTWAPVFADIEKELQLLAKHTVGGAHVGATG